VDSLAPHYAAAAVSVVPLHAGGGTRLKILESLAYAVPVVSTDIGAFGIDAGRDEGLYRADTDEGFADGCLALLTAAVRGSSECLAMEGREFIRRRYDWLRIQEQVATLARRALERADAV